MEHSEFKIGKEFTCGEGTWRCTDVGTRVVVAIRIDKVDRTTLAPGSLPETDTVSGEEAATQGWFGGPPYGVAEVVFDEDDFEACEAV